MDAVARIFVGFGVSVFGGLVLLFLKHLGPPPHFYHDYSNIRQIRKFRRIRLAGITIVVLGGLSMLTGFVSVLIYHRIVGSP